MYLTFFLFRICTLLAYTFLVQAQKIYNSFLYTCFCYFYTIYNFYTLAYCALASLNKFKLSLNIIS